MNSASWYAQPLMRLNDSVSERLRSSPLLVRVLFGTRVERGVRKRYWDYTTLVLKKALSRFVRPGLRILEIGVGDYALLSIYVAKHFPVSVTGVDIVPEVVVNARRTALANAVRIDLRESDMFSQCDGAYDLVFWNIPYVPRGAQQGRQAQTFGDVIWDGGSDGTELIRRCLDQAPGYLTERGRLLLGINTFYVSGANLSRIVAASPFQLEGSIGAWPNPSRVFVLALAGADRVA